ncbi:lipopolysaccharide/colanic/teichoic acid biosynthesis glycosyltransferase [Pacificibacter maritimus]|uniref:Lipopolysaccharide/colanic/teichoic acid biosynthesis glycosyltransferase n=1 Tax=Pacificibacter maritimus TaxID=762213 RepID=A0A3N4TX51_9RHOB|nr:sugar transferase [Pacificibacter maritimus]RPE63123.1 lipopolysaccharide/colanic/teichoic acid biosynthesis glycosyltransferase [Pacificibacter maritimus]
MTLGKRFFDIGLALVLSIILAPVVLILAVVLLVKEGGPVFYLSERMKTVDKGFLLIKFRTMRMVSDDRGVSGGDKLDRITPLGRIMRKTRLDELPQLWNVLRGDISFVGPRPPLRIYVEQFPELYGQVLKSRPGITGLASVRFYAHEELLLSRCHTAQETDRVYVRDCIPRKAKLDIIYQKHRSLCFDIRLMIETILPRIQKF